MKKIFAYVGSGKDCNSYTFKLTKAILDKVVSSSHGKIQYTLLSPEKVNINFCVGCKCCFEKGFCPLDSKDSMDFIKKELIKSDLIILASPVYSHNLTGHMKVFIDRLTYWMHIFRLAGKLGITISTSDSNGNEYVNQYLNKFMQYCGIYILCNFKAVQMLNPLINDTFTNLDIESVSKIICDYLLNNHEIKASTFQEAIYQNFKNYLLQLKESDVKNYEISYWEENGYLNANSFTSILCKLKN